MLVHPNPTVDFLYLEGLAEPASIRITSALGIQMQMPPLVQKDAQVTIDVSTFPAGTYFLTYEAGQTAYQATFVKCK